MTIRELTDAQIYQADMYQKMGLTFTEIANRLGLSREQVVQELYWKRIRT